MNGPANRVSPPRILLYTDDPDEGGVAIYNHAILCGLARAGYTTACAQSLIQSEMVDLRTSLGVEHFWLSYHTRREPELNFNGYAEAAAVFEKAQPDLILFTNCDPVSNHAARSVAVARGLPFVIVEHFVVPRTGFTPEDAWLLHFRKEHYRLAQAVVAVSADNLNLLRLHYGLDFRKGEVIHNGRPDVFFEPRREDRRLALRRSLGIPLDAIVCLTTARLAPVKGYGHQLAAIRTLQASDAWPHLHFVWAGAGPQEDHIRAAVAAGGITARVHLVGQRTDITNLLDASDIFVLPSHREGMPLSIMEAMAKGLPVVASSVSGIPEELGDAGVLVADPNTDSVATERELATAIEVLAQDSERRSRIGEAGRSRAARLFREDRMIRDTIHMVERSLLPKGDYASPGLKVVRPDHCFPHLAAHDAASGAGRWKYFRSEIPHNYYCDGRSPETGFLSRDEALLLHNLALPFRDAAALEIGCWLGWSACHLALAGVRLSVVDPVLSNPAIMMSVRESLSAAGVLDHVHLVAEPSLQGVDRLVREGRGAWKFVFIDGNHDAPHPVFDAAIVAEYATADCLVVFRDLTCPDVANGLQYFKLRGWHTMIYQTSQIMGVAWRGNVTPVTHIPDPNVHWHLPRHLAGYPVSGMPA